jgi:hypothetical protein
MKPDDIISYSDLVREDRADIQRVMDFRVESEYRTFLVSPVTQWLRGGYRPG